MNKINHRSRNQQGFMGVAEAIIILIVLGVMGFGAWKVYSSRSDKSSSQTTTTTVSAPSQNSKTWQVGGVAVAGNWADADVVSLGGGRYRMYYSVEPEVSGNKLEMYSATSEDGIKWTQEAGTRKTFATFPSVLKLPDGKWRLYFQNAGVIKSALSSDGLSWQDEAGTRLDAANSLGLNFENVAAPSVERLDDGTYLMVYRGTVNQAYNDQAPNKNTQLFLWATSKDGLSWEKQGLAIDSRNSTLQGLADGPEFVPKWDDGSVKLFFWGYAGVYESTYANNQFSQPKLVYSGQSSSSQNKFPQNPPGDPTLLKVGDTWYMYYGQHTKGIYYATLK